MKRRPTCVRAVQTGCFLAGLLIVGVALATAQNLPPGRLPAGPPPQPGQLEPPAKTSKKPQSSPSTNQQGTNDAALPPGTRPYSVTGREVLVPTTVLDPDGHGYVNGLNSRDFELLDNDKPQKIDADFSELPVSLVLVVQANSEVEPLLPKIRKSGILLHGLVTGTEGDVAVLAFDHRMLHIQDFTSDPQKIDDAMQKITSGSNTAALIDAVLEADHMLKRHDPRNVRRRVVVLLSRNADHGSEAHLQETVRSMQFDNVIIYCVDISKALTAALRKPDYPRPANGGVPPEALPNLRGNGAYSDTAVLQQQTGNALNAVPPLLRSIHDLFKKTPAEAFSYFTGGRVYSFAREKALEDAITDVGKDLNSQYLLSYTPSNKEDPGFHTIRVIVNRPGLKVFTRPGYWWGGGQQ